MRTMSLPITLRPQTATRSRQIKKVLVEFDADRFERLAANLGFFNPAFLASLQRAEKDYRAGRIRQVASLKELRH